MRGQSFLGELRLEPYGALREVLRRQRWDAGAAARYIDVGFDLGLPAQSGGDEIDSAAKPWTESAQVCNLPKRTIEQRADASWPSGFPAQSWPDARETGIVNCDRSTQPDANWLRSQ